MSQKSTDTVKFYTINVRATFKVEDKEKMYEIWETFRQFCKEYDGTLGGVDFNNPKDLP